MGRLVPFVVFKAGGCQGFLAVFFFEEPGVLERDLHMHAFEEGVAEGENVAFLGRWV